MEQSSTPAPAWRQQVLDCLAVLRKHHKIKDDIRKTRLSTYNEAMHMVPSSQPSQSLMDSQYLEFRETCVKNHRLIALLQVDQRKTEDELYRRMAELISIGQRWPAGTCGSDYVYFTIKACRIALRPRDFLTCLKFSDLHDDFLMLSPAKAEKFTTASAILTACLEIEREIGDMGGNHADDPELREMTSMLSNLMSGEAGDSMQDCQSQED